MHPKGGYQARMWWGCGWGCGEVSKTKIFKRKYNQTWNFLKDYKRN